VLALNYTAPTEPVDNTDWNYIVNKGTFIVGYTQNAPMAMKNGDELSGFDIDLPIAVVDYLNETYNTNIKIKFVEINWVLKETELSSKAIDCVWNGMTLTDEVTSAMECSNAYCNNAQVVIVPASEADKYQDTDSLSDLSFAVEAGSAGEAAVADLDLEYTPVKAQSDALMEVAAGTSSAAVTYTCGLNDEEYGVGFRKGSDLANALNDFFASAYADGSMMECAETYGVQAAIIEQ